MDKNISIADRVYDYVEEAILSGTFKKDEIISELKLCKLLDVSRTPVREALTRLLVEGLIRESGKGAVVVGISTEDMEDIYDIRMRIEGLAAAKCARNISPKELETLREVLELQEFYTFKQQPENIKKVDSEFHRLIYMYCGSKILEKLLTDLHRKVQRYRRNSLGDIEIANAAIIEHRQIFDAIAAKDEKTAEQLTVAHVVNAKKRLNNNETK